MKNLIQKLGFEKSYIELDNIKAELINALMLDITGDKAEVLKRKALYGMGQLINLTARLHNYQGHKKQEEKETLVDASTESESKSISGQERDARLSPLWRETANNAIDGESLWRWTLSLSHYLEKYIDNMTNIQIRLRMEYKNTPTTEV